MVRHPEGPMFDALYVWIHHPARLYLIYISNTHSGMFHALGYCSLRSLVGCCRNQYSREILFLRSRITRFSCLFVVAPILERKIGNKLFKSSQWQQNTQYPQEIVEKHQF